MSHLEFHPLLYSSTWGRFPMPVTRMEVGMQITARTCVPLDILAPVDDVLLFMLVYLGRLRFLWPVFPWLASLGSLLGLPLSASSGFLCGSSFLKTRCLFSSFLVSFITLNKDKYVFSSFIYCSRQVWGHSLSVFSFLSTRQEKAGSKIILPQSKTGKVSYG